MRLNATDTTKVMRGSKRQSDSTEEALRLIDSTVMCHLGHQEDGQTIVTPTCHWRDENHLYWHSHRQARNGRTRNTPVCINICALDGLVLAHSAFAHSVNYRSLSVFGVPESIEDADAKAYQLRRLVEKLTPGRWDALRPMTSQEVAATSVMRLSLEQCSFKVRTGPPGIKEGDEEWPVWTGLLPCRVQWGEPCGDCGAESFDVPHVGLSLR